MQKRETERRRGNVVFVLPILVGWKVVKPLVVYMMSTEYLFTPSTVSVTLVPLWGL